MGWYGFDADNQAGCGTSGQMPEIVIIGGPNGAGKTTSSRRILPVFDIRAFVNADEIACGLSPDPSRGGRNTLAASAATQPAIDASE
jgi:predicted ABC-type ATPase